MVKNIEELKKQLEIPDNEYDARITNIVFGVDLKGQVPLDKIANTLETAEYEPESFPGLVYRIPDYKATALIFTSGMSILSGVNNVDTACKAAKKMVEDFEKIGIKFYEEPEMKIVNLVISATLHREIDLNRTVYELGDCEYEPEQFPGLIHRVERFGVVMLLFNSGRIIVTGSKSVKLSIEAIQYVEKRLKEIGAIA